MDAVELLMTVAAVAIAFGFAGGLVMDCFNWEDE